MHHQGPIAGVAARAHWIATAGYDNRLILWDSRRRVALARVQHDHLVNHCAFSPDGRWLVSASSDYTARLWSLPDLKLQTVFGGHGDDVDMAVFSPDSLQVATCALDRHVRIFDLQGRCLHDMQGHTGNVLSLAWSADGQQLVSSSVDGTIRHWDTQTGQALQCIDLQVRTDSVEMAEDGCVYAGDDRGRIALIRNGMLRFVQAHRAGVKKIALDARLGRLVSLSYDRSMAVWQFDADEGLREISCTVLPPSIWARAAAVLPDGRIAAGTFGNSYALYDPASGAWDLQQVAAGSAINDVLVHDGQVLTVGDAGEVRADGALLAAMGSLCNFLCADGHHLYTGGQMGQLYDARSGTVLHEHHAPLNCGVVIDRAAGRCLAVGTYTGDVLIFDLSDPAQPRLSAELKLYENAVKGLSYGNGLLFSVCANTDVAWHDVQNWQLQRRLDHAHERIANDCCALGDGRFASVSRDRHLRLWRGQGDTVEAHASPHPNSVKCMAVDAAGKTVLTGSYGGTLALFYLDEKRWAPLIRPTTAGISSISWDPARARFLAASYDGQLYPVNPMPV